MNTITVEVHQGNYIIETAEVKLMGRKIVDIKLMSNSYRPLSASLVEASRLTWKEEYARMGWDISENEQISRAIGMNLWHVDDILDVDEDSWLDSAYEDKFAGVEYFE